MNDVLSLYRGAPLPVRLFTRGRVILSDLEFVERHVPRAGTILDLGCGHGLFANLMALRSSERKVIGVDLSPAKIGQARATIGGRTNIEFIRGDMLELDLPACDVVTIVDVLYLLPRDEQLKILKACRRILKPGGWLVWKAQETTPRYKYYLTYCQELITTTIGITRGRRGGLCFLSREVALAALGEAGFIPRAVEMSAGRPYTDVLYLGRK